MTYRLRPVRDERDRAERVQCGELAGQVRSAEETAAAVERVRAKIARLEALVTEARAKTAGTTAAQLVVAERYVARRRAELDRARLELAQAIARHATQASAVDAARVRLQHARAEKEVIERHWATWRDTQRKLAERREE